MDKKKHIFLVEDELHLRYTLSLILRKSGFLVTSAEDGEKAFQMIEDIISQAGKIDMLVTDIQMPGMNGIEIIDKLRKKNIDLPCLVITGYSNKATMKELLSKGCADYLDKPFEPEEFIKQVNKVLEKKNSIEIEKAPQKESHPYPKEAGGGYVYD